MLPLFLGVDAGGDFGALGALGDFGGFFGASDDFEFFGALEETEDNKDNVVAPDDAWAFGDGGGFLEEAGFFGVLFFGLSKEVRREAIASSSPSSSSSSTRSSPFLGLKTMFNSASESLDSDSVLDPSSSSSASPSFSLWPARSSESSESFARDDELER